MLRLTPQHDGNPLLPQCGRRGLGDEGITPLGKIALPRLQVRTIEQLLNGEGFLIPSAAMLMGVSRAERVQDEVYQGELEL